MRYNGYENRPYGKELYKLWSPNQSIHIGNLERVFARCLGKMVMLRKVLEGLQDSGDLFPKTKKRK